MHTDCGGSNNVYSDCVVDALCETYTHITPCSVWIRDNNIWTVNGLMIFREFGGLCTHCVNLKKQTHSLGSLSGNLFLLALQ